MGRDVGEVADAIIVVDAGGGVDQDVPPNDGVRLNDGPVQDHRAFPNGGRCRDDGCGVTGDAVTCIQHFHEFGALCIVADTQNHRTVEGGKMFFSSEADSRPDTGMAGMPTLGSIIENAADTDALTAQNVDDHVGMSARSVNVK